MKKAFKTNSGIVKLKDKKLFKGRLKSKMLYKSKLRNMYPSKNNKRRRIIKISMTKSELNIKSFIFQMLYFINNINVIIYYKIKTIVFF